MSMQEVREQNIALVTQTALACFVENGIEKTTIRDIAQHAGLTERGAYRGRRFGIAGRDLQTDFRSYLFRHFCLHTASWYEPAGILPPCGLRYV